MLFQYVFAVFVDIVITIVFGFICFYVMSMWLCYRRNVDIPYKLFSFFFTSFVAVMLIFVWHLYVSVEGFYYNFFVFVDNICGEKQ